MKKILAILLTVCMVVCMIPAGGAFAAEPPKWSDQISDVKAYNENSQKTGYDYKVDSTNSTLYIATAKGLAWYANDNANTYNSYTVVLENDINLSAYVWDKPIGHTTAFTATFDGNNKKISGLKMENSTSTVAGLFGQTSNNAIIKNLTVTGTSIKCAAETSAVGGLIGKVTGSTKVINCNVDFTALTAGTSGTVGAIAVNASTESVELEIIGTNSTSTSIPAVGGIANKLIVRSASLNAPIKATNLEAYASTLTEAEASTVTLSNNSKVGTLNTSTGATLAGATITTMNLTGNAGDYKIDVTADNSIGTLNCGLMTPKAGTANPQANLNVTTATNTGTAFNTGTDPLKFLFGDDASVVINSKTDSSGTLNTYTVEYQAMIGSTKYTTLEKAFAAAKLAGTATIKLTGVSLTANKNKLTAAVVDSGSITIDVNGHDFTLETSVTCYGNLIIKDTATTKGLITVPENEIAQYSGKLQLQIGKYANNPEAYVDTNFYKIEGSTNPYTVSPKATINLGSNTSVTVNAIADQKYTKYAITPKPVVKYGTTTLVEGTDYTLAYRSNTNIGTVYIPTVSDQTYTGYAVKPNIYVYYGGATASTARTLLTENVHYTVTYSSNIYPGTAIATITGKGSYAGSITRQFAIKYNLSNATVTLSTTSYSYDGYAKRPAVTVKVGTRTVPSTDYDVTYLNNTNVGTASVLVSAKKYGTSTGSSTAYFSILGKNGAITPEYTAYNSKTTKSEPFAIRILSNTTDGTGYSYTSSNTNVAIVSSNGTVTVNGCGKTVITITTTGNKEYYPAEAKVTVTVKPPTGKIGSVVSSSRGKMSVAFEKVAAAQKGTVRYQIRYSRDKDFEYGTYKTATFKSTKAEANASAKKTVSGLVSGDKYYVKVRGYLVLDDGSKVYGKWSKVRSVRIK